jgi:4-aminobutyrate aminotransferase
MIGIEIAHDGNKPWPELRDRIVAESFKRGLIVQGAGQSAVRLSPPLIIDRDQADFALEALEDCIRSSVANA